MGGGEAEMESGHTFLRFLTLPLASRFETGNLKPYDADKYGQTPFCTPNVCSAQTSIEYTVYNVTV